ncbi:hypothetical protein LTR40_012775, partial [Exophiala xenobiotica]
STTEPSDSLYEAQISCVITGADKWRWVAYCFVDVYHEAEGKETVSQYYEDSMGGNGSRTDPLTLDPREYFLKVYQIRLNQVKREWRRVVERLRQVVRAYEENPLSHLEDFAPPIKTEKH